MKEKVASLETEIALMRSDINAIQHREPQLPKWLKKSAVIVLGAMFTQIMTSVWWASKITTNMNNLKSEVADNSEFRSAWPVYHQELLVGIKEIQVNLDNQKDMLNKVKNKLLYIRPTK